MTDAQLTHDMCNELSTILGFAGILLADATLGDNHRRDLEEIRRAAEAALELIARCSLEDSVAE